MLDLRIRTSTIHHIHETCFWSVPPSLTSRGYSRLCNDLQQDHDTRQGAHLDLLHPAICMHDTLVVTWTSCHLKCHIHKHGNVIHQASSTHDASSKLFKLFWGEPGGVGKNERQFLINEVVNSLTKWDSWEGSHPNLSARSLRREGYARWLQRMHNTSIALNDSHLLVKNGSEIWRHLTRVARLL